MQCRTVLKNIDALRTEEVSEGEQRELQGHFTTCSSCAESIDDVGQFASRIKALPLRPHRSVVNAVLANVADRYDELGSGDLHAWVAFTEHGARLIHAGPASFEEFAAAHEERFGRELVPGTMPAKLRQQIEAAMEGRGASSPLVDVSGLTDFERDVLELLARIPRGEVRSYAWLAREAGRPKAMRAVGNVMARNPVPLLMPCHRVVPTSGGVGKYAFGSPFKRALLAREGVEVDRLEELARRGVRFIGSATTHIFCFPTCRDARRIREENRVPLHDEREAVAKGYRGCQHCRPAA
jgi:O-6-methylguanine DNA methyltransferase